MMLYSLKRSLVSAKMYYVNVALMNGLQYVNQGPVKPGRLKSLYAQQKQRSILINKYRSGSMRSARVQGVGKDGCVSIEGPTKVKQRDKPKCPAEVGSY